MNVFSIIALAGGAAFFIFGMKVLSRALEASSGERLRKALGRLTDGKVRGILLGAGITAAVQSSSAVTVMLTGLADSGMIELESAVGVIMGSNIGTTSTAWLMCLSGQSGALKEVFASLTPAAAISGIMLISIKKKPNRRAAGEAALGFAVMMNGMEIMQKAAAPLSEQREVFTAFENPFVSLVVSALFTAVVQSSSASVGILQALSASGAISLSAAVPIIAGQNIGTCATAVLASLPLNKNAKRVTAAHVIFNLTGSAVFMLMYLAAKAVGADLAQAANPISVAASHTFFNVLSTAVLLPFGKGLPRATRRIVK